MTKLIDDPTRKIIRARLANGELTRERPHSVESPMTIGSGPASTDCAGCAKPIIGAESYLVFDGLHRPGPERLGERQEVGEYFRKAGGVSHEG